MRVGRRRAHERTAVMAVLFLFVEVDRANGSEKGIGN